MRIKSLTRSFLSLLLSLVLGFSSFPILALAGEEPQTAPWAADAVEALNATYVDNPDKIVFTGDSAFATVEEVRELLMFKLRYRGDDKIIKEHLSTGGNLTRLQAAQVIFKVYQLDRLISDPGPWEFEDCSDPAAATLRFLGIVNGKADGTFAPDEPITNAELAVIFYRALRKIGAVYVDEGSFTPKLKPGQYGYDELMYLFTRGCVPKEIDPHENLSSAKITEQEDQLVEYSGKKEIWEMWCSKLEKLPPESSSQRTVSFSVYDSEDVAAANTILDAAVLIVAEDRAALNNDKNITGIFSDVGPSWFYEGVMYLFNIGMVNGYGNGWFGPQHPLKRGEMAVLICRFNGIDATNPAEGVVLNDTGPNDYFYNPITHAIKNGYMAYINPEEKHFDPWDPVTRQEVAEALFRSYRGFEAEDVNLSVLDRFKDSPEIEDRYKTSMAYLVSAGVINGSADGNVAPGREITRAEFGVVLARVMMGLDRSKMRDYETAVTEVLK